MILFWPEPLVKNKSKDTNQQGGSQIISAIDGHIYSSYIYMSMCVCIWNMINYIYMNMDIYIPNNSFRKLLELINNFDKLQDKLTHKNQ